jgi:hypothetical protein
VTLIWSTTSRDLWCPKESFTFLVRFALRCRASPLETMKPVLSLLVLSVFLSCLGVAQGQVVDQLVDPISLEFSGGNVIIVFDDLRPDTSDTNFQAEHSDDVTGWTGIAQSSLVQHPTIADRYTLTAPEPLGPRRFYRIIGYSTTAEDDDGDGLSDTLEGIIGTDPLLFDTDNDGFSDRLEAALFPNDPDKTPDLTIFPQVQFAETLSTTTEGDGEWDIAIEFDRAYNGTVHFAIHASGTGIEGTDFDSITEKTVAVNGTTANITIESKDNTLVDPHRLIMIDIIDEPTTRTYRTGGRARHILCLADNDHYWSGTLTSDLLVRNFRIKCIHMAGSCVISFVAGSDDGLLPDPEGGTTSQSVGLVPDGTHAATVSSDTPALFVVSVDFPAIQQSTLFGDKLNAVRTLRLAATHGASFPKIVERRLLDGSDPPMPLVPNGQHTVIFNIYDHLTASGVGNLKWGPSTQLVDFSGGRFETILGPDDDASSPLLNVFSSSADRFLGITVQGMSEISPRKQIMSPAQQSIGPDQIVGIYTDTVGTDLVPSASSTDTGIFALIRNPSAAPEIVEPPFQPIP